MGSDSGQGKSKKTDTKKSKPDRLAEAIRKKRQEATIDGKDMVVVKWNLRTSCEMMVRLGTILEQVIGKAQGDLDISTFLRSDLAKVVQEHLDDIVAVLSHTVVRDNFNDLEEAQAWVEELGLAEAVELFTIIVEQNLRPLVSAARKINEKVRSAAGSKALKALRP